MKCSVYVYAYVYMYVYITVSGRFSITFNIFWAYKHEGGWFFGFDLAFHGNSSLSGLDLFR